MTEELNNFNTDMKELFMNNQFDDIIDALSTKSDAEISELTYANYDVIKKYYDLEKFDIIFTHIKFVAYACFFCEYANKRGVIDDATFEAMALIFTGIHAKMQEAN